MKCPSEIQIIDKILINVLHLQEGLLFLCKHNASLPSTSAVPSGIRRHFINYSVASSTDNGAIVTLISFRSNFQHSKNVLTSCNLSSQQEKRPKESTSKVYLVSEGNPHIGYIGLVNIVSLRSSLIVFTAKPVCLQHSRQEAKLALELTKCSLEYPFNHE